MIDPPFEILDCSWPRPVKQSSGRWVSRPDWDAPRMHSPPRPTWQTIQGEPCFAIDWRAQFDGNLRRWTPHAGEMRNFHVVFRLRVMKSGMLIFWDDDGSVIRRNGELIHRDDTSHPPTRHQLSVTNGDVLDVAQWQFYGNWIWGGRVESESAPDEGAAVLLKYLGAVQRRLANPDGPTLKVYCSGATPLRTVLGIYSMILNGYSPRQVLLFGEYQWTPASRQLFGFLLPFAIIIPTESVIEQLGRLGHTQLVQWARDHFLVMKTCVGILYPPTEYCLMDDDIFILESVNEASSAFQKCNLVFAPDRDYGANYSATWGQVYANHSRLRTATFNAGLYWMRHRRDLTGLAAAMLRAHPSCKPFWLWEQGFIATQFAQETTHELPAQRYFYPLFDGLPGGIVGYDYATNPCEFVSIHFGGLREKPSDAVAQWIAPEILDRKLSVSVNRSASG